MRNGIQSSQNVGLFLVFLFTCILNSFLYVNAQRVQPPPMLMPHELHFPDPPLQIKSWRWMSFRWGDYDFGINDDTFHEKQKCTYIRSITESVPEYSRGTLFQMFKANNYLNKRMKFSAVMKSIDNDSMSVALSVKIDGLYHDILRFDDMYGRNLTGTKDWDRYKVVTDVPQDSSYIEIGISMRGIGQVWISDAKLEETTDEITGKPVFEDEPGNVKFSEE
jgi:hypothetical protein